MSDKIRKDCSISVQSFKFAQTHQTLILSVFRANTMLNANPTAAHFLIASRIRTIYQMITREWKIEGHIYFAAGRWPAGKLENLRRLSSSSGERAVFTTCSCCCPPHGIFYNSAAQPDRGLLKLPIRGYVQASGKRSRAEFRCMKCTNLTFRRNVIPGIPTGFF